MNLGVGAAVKEQVVAEVLLAALAEIALAAVGLNSAPPRGCRWKSPPTPTPASTTVPASS